MNIISLFSGAGGLDLGFEQNGFEPLVAYDINAAAVCTYNHNRVKKVAVQADLSTLTGENIIDQIVSLDVHEKIVGVIGGPPCQYFSNGNKSVRDPNDVRRILPIKYANILKDLNIAFDLDFFVFENVVGLIKPKFNHEFEKIIEMFDDAGFHIEYKVLNAYNFDVAQNRERVIIVGWNKKRYQPNNYVLPNGNPSGLTIRNKIFGLLEPQFYAPNLNPDEFPVHPNHWTMVPKSKKFFGSSNWAPRTGARSFRRLKWDEPSYTVAYGHNEIHVHPDGRRRLSIYEASRLQGFPKSYVLKGNFSEQVVLVSDAVPPPLANEIARSVKDHILANK